MRDGREITHPGKPGTPHHKEIVAPAGPIDPDVGVLAVRRPRRQGVARCVGVVVHFACHSTVVGGDLFSPDYAGYLRKHLQAHYGENAAGRASCSGRAATSRRWTTCRRASEFGPEYADMMGRSWPARRSASSAG